MRAISLWQPWASLIANGVKTIETRSWPTSYRGPIAIHASKREVCGIGWKLVNELREGGIESVGMYYPLGAIVAVANLTSCAPSNSYVTSWADAMCGDFSPGRFAWELRDIKKLKEPFYCRGHQGLFNIEIHEEYLP